ncbi:hypothetical protein LAZ67_18001399 [Cordylochernes scorpioides]|uniref:Integrase zinc-binding domain-containing protein n=1 Tax=Cordylochernes scorpioides TaxID=51811 RepID=A0ABY6LIH5_9ARAC|nr:hypothetical protein LAZ67_18001399 [Cordylochernes scorpioides]
MTPTYKSFDRENDAEIKNQTHKLTKRIMLSKAYAVFDPLGLFSPFTIVPKIILQQCWKSELKWDQQVPEDIEKFVEWQSQIPELLSVRIPRWVMKDGFKQASLHVFCDASQDAYATCIYLRTVKNKEVNVQLVASKARVAPKKKLTFPRLELMSCLIGSRLTKQVMKIISESIAIPEPNIWFWMDSSTALLRNRVNEICSISKKENWHHVSGTNNPAYLPSQEINEELKKTVNIAVNSTKVNFMDKLESYGDYHRIVRIVAYLLRFKTKTVSDQSRPGQHDKMSKEISVEEFEEAEKFFRGENQVVKLLIRKEHEMMSHAGIQTTQQLVRRRFWILKGKRTIRSIISACATCRRYNSKRVQTESIPIPAPRIGSTPAFGVIGVDLAGPLTESGGKKIWVVLYTCAVYRAVHLELTKTVSTEGFLDTFRRFVARRGRPSLCTLTTASILSDAITYSRKLIGMMSYIMPPYNVLSRISTPQQKHFGEDVLEDKTVSYEELQTVICEVESAMNSRPLTAISEESGLVPITTCQIHSFCDKILETRQSQLKKAMLYSWRSITKSEQNGQSELLRKHTREKMASENHSKEYFGKGRDLEKEKKINLDTPSISQRSIRRKYSPVITRSGIIVKQPDRY